MSHASPSILDRAVGATAVSSSTIRQATSLAVWQRILCFTLLAITIFPLWYSLGDHPLYPRSEGRYATVSRDMLVHDHWLIPRYDGQTHVTKPLLAYWAQAGCMAWLGQNEWACRLPSAFAGTAVLIMLFALGWYLYDIRLAALATGVLGMMPLFLVVSRLTLTDSLLNMFWFAAMACGFLAMNEPPGRRRGVFLCFLWIAVAGGWMTKGPLALVPVGVLAIWLILAGRWRKISVLWPVTGLLASMIPIAAWVGLVAYKDPQAWHLWYMQMIGRAVGTGDHPRPIWYFLPVFLGGMFPATCMMLLPGSNYSFKRIRPMLRSGSQNAYWALQIILPLIIFSLIKGKLATYILPLCAPMAILAGQTLLAWIDRRHDNPPAGFRPPEVVATFFVCLVLTLAVIMGLLVYQYGTRFLPGLAYMALAAVAAGWMWWIWKRKPAWRTAALVLIFLAYAVNLSAAAELEDAMLTPGSTRTLVQTIKKRTGIADPTIVTYGYRDTVLAFYADDWDETEGPEDLRDWLNKDDSRVVVVAQTSDWKRLEKTDPALADQFKLIFTWNRSPLTTNRVVLRPKVPHILNEPRP